MRAIDTNIVVRFLTGDEPALARKARAVIDAGPVLVLTTVLLESEWVLRSGYWLGKAEVIEALTGFSGLPNAMLQEPERVSRALEWAAGGLDFADALHLAAAADCEALVSLDTKLAKAAKRVGALPVEAP